jgi:NhaP-type Na+/H+ or K+/H+ antiporter
VANAALHKISRKPEQFPSTREPTLDQKLFFYVALVPLLGILAQWISYQLRLPSILLLLFFGILLGQFMNPDAILESLLVAESNATRATHDLGPKILFPLISLSVGIIMFEGGLSLRLRELRESGKTVLRLVTLGALISLVLTALAAYFLLGLNWRIAVLLGGILVVTGPTVVVPMLRHIRPSQRVGAIVKWEGIVIDPIGAILAVLIFERLIYDLGDEWFSGQSLFILARTVLIALVLGFAAAALCVQVIKRYLVPDYLHGFFFLAVAIGVFALSNYFQHDSGLVTVTLLGVLLANQKSISIEHVVHFKENLGVLIVSCLFIVLGSRLVVNSLWQVGPRGLVFLAVLIFVVRPLAVFLSTIKTETSFRERVFLAFLAPRGIVAAAVASVFGLHIKNMISHGGTDHALALLADDAAKLVPATFLVIVGTVLFYGLAAPWVARLLKLEDANPQGILFAGADRWICQIAGAVRDAGFQVALVDTNFRRVSAAKVAGINATCISVLAEDFAEQVDLSGIGRLIAMTGSDEVNTLACQEFKHMFGREHVYQLTPGDADAGTRSSVSEKLLGRTFLDKTLTRDRLVELFQQGWDVKTTKLSEQFTFEDFQEMYADEAILLFAVDQQNRLQIISEELNTETSQLLIFLATPGKKTG